MFDGIFEAIEEWMRGLLTGMVESNLTTMFTDVNEKTGEIGKAVKEVRNADCAGCALCFLLISIEIWNKARQISNEI